MPVNIQILFGRPQHEIASILRDRLTRCSRASLVSGFMTVEGMEAIADPLKVAPAKLHCLVVGAGTFRAYEAFDRLIAAGVSPAVLHVYLGHTRPTGVGAKNRFYKYHPMLHSKVYLLEMPDGSSTAFIGSHNLTGFALLGLNGEAGVLIDGPTNSPEITAIQDHVNQSRTQSIQYTPEMKEAYSWWTTQFVEGLRSKVDDEPQEGEARRTIVILSVKADDPLPKKDDIIYFEIPAALGRIQSLSAEVHIYIFGTRPTSATAGLVNLKTCRTALWCQTRGLEDEQGGVELRADWFIESKSNPSLLRASKPFRPTPTPAMQQVRVKVWNQVFDQYEYLFGKKKASWEPVFDEQSVLELPRDDQRFLKSLDLIPPEDKPWFLVKGLHSTEDSGNEAYKKALREASPESGNFILLSMRRRIIGR
jgi:HKD family nuclease